ncbi:MAG: DUF4959 domain-containing protein [Tannerella sp.]|jgi:hypothetical protein|nr:DUF4959 domain-containing protein [Tannerella sp.]
MKKNIFIILLPVVFFACQAEERPEIIMDNIPPASVTDVQVRNTPGGAVLKYQLPDDEDLLYVKALYSWKEGHQADVKTSMYNDSIVIEGFGDEDEHEVQLVAVDRSKNESAPVQVTIKPLEPLVFAIRKTLKVYSDFGGVHLYWENPDRANISVIIEKKDLDEYIPVETFYSSVVAGEGVSRGMDTISCDFRVYVQDRWENQSAPLDTILTPLFEAKFDRTKFQAMYLDGDEPSAWGWVLPNLFDGSTGSGFHTDPGTTGNWPHVFSFDMGVKGKISRIILWPRSGYYYFHGHVKHFDLWGTNDAGNLNDWNSYVKLVDCVGIKPSGLPVGSVSDEDREHLAGGEEFVFPIDAPPVRYLRYRALETWGGDHLLHIMEIEVYGSIEQ